MLASAHRLRKSADFQRTVRHGRRAASGTVVVHLLDVETDVPTRVGFVVSKAVGPAVRRNLVKRRLRHLVRPLTAEAGRLVVVRANPQAGTAPYASIAADLRRCVDALGGATT